MSEPFDPELLREAARLLPDIDDAVVETVVERGTHLFDAVPPDAYPLLAMALRAGDEPLIRARQVIDAARAHAPHVPPVFVTMVTAAVLARPELRDPITAVCHVLDRGAELAVRRPSDWDAAGSNVHVVWQIAGYRAALDELSGVDSDVHALADELGTMTTTAFPSFLGGEQLFGQLTSTEPDLPELVDAEPDGTTPDEDTITSWLVAELTAGTTATQRRVISEWVTGLRSPTTQDDLALLVDRLRRVERRLARCPGAPPEFVTSQGSPRLRAAVGAAIRNSNSFPPLWTDRGAAVSLAAGKLRQEMDSGPSAWPTAMLVAGVVVRGLGQEVHRANDPDRPFDCGCGADSRALRTAPPPEQVCPHRTWPETGRVEDYTTLARAARVGDEAVAQLNLKQYQGLWQEWVEDARARVD